MVKAKMHDVCTMFPPMTEDEIKALREDVRSKGVLSPVWIWNGMVIDGRHRVEIAEELGVDYPTREFEGEESELVSFVLSLNSHRRHLSSSQRAAIGSQALALQRKIVGPGRGVKPKKTEGADGSTPDAEAPAPVDDQYDELAKQIGTNRRYMKFADKLRVERPDVFKKVVSGDVTLYTVINELGDDLKGNKEPEPAPGRPDEDEAGSVVKDELGHDIPMDLREAWADLDEFRSLCTTLRDVRKRIKTLCERMAGAYLERALPEVNAALKSVEKELKTMQPYTICPHCNGTACNQCRGMGWIPKGVFDLMPDEDREAWSGPVAAF